MKHMLCVLLTFSLTLCAGRITAQDAFSTDVRVWLMRWQSAPLRITCEAPWQALSRDNSTNIPPAAVVVAEVKGNRVVLRLGTAALRSEEWNLQGEAPFTLSSMQGNNSRTYRGRIVLRVNRGRLQVLNVLPLEDYLLGVVPLEMPPSFPAEALKAQAISARSWTVRNRLKHQADGADVCDGIHCQVYGGVTAERESTSTAVRSTAGLILVRDDAPVDATYTADCGGQPASGNHSTPLPPDTSESGQDYCSANPQHRWSLGFSFLEVWQAAGEKDSPQSTPKGDVDVQIAQTDAGRRVLKVQIRCGDFVREISGAQLRSRLSLPSTLFSVRLDQGNAVVFEGSGSGHGAGLCQWGAAGRARAGQSADQILQAYYPGARIVPLSEAMWEWRKNRKSSSVR